MLSKGVLSARLFQPYLWLTLSGFCFGANRDSDLFLIFPFTSNFSSGYLRWSTR